MWSNPGFIGDFLRGFFSILDSIGYFFLSGIFNIFFTIANAEIFQGSVINTFYSRIQMILGILMIFRISITLLQIIVNPDMFKDKQKGAGSLVMRIAVMLILLTLIVPINISNTNGNPLNEQIKSNGILFGFLYQFQNSIVEDNILGKLILGSDPDTTTSDSGGTQLPGMASVGDVITSEIAKAFITPAINDGYDDINEDNYKEAAVCPDVVSPYFNPLVTSGSLIDHVNDTCVNGSEAYAFDYTGFGGVVCAVVMTIIIIGFTLDIAVRAIKLALLRLIAPVPIISYISLGQEKDGAFGNWVKTLTSTYLSLFIRLIIIYFGIYLIIILREGDLVSWVHTSNALTTGLANIFIIIGILVFMKDAPKFFQDMLGIKGDGKLFSGIGTMLGAAALTGGLAGSIATGARAAWEENKIAGRPGWMGVGGAITSGITSGLGGAFVGAKALATSDQKVPSSVMSAMQKRNATRASHSTALGRLASSAYGMATGMTLAERDQAVLDLNKDAASNAGKLKDLIETEAIKYGDYGSLNFTSNSGNHVKGNFNYSRLAQAIQTADPNTGQFDYYDESTGARHTFNAKDFDQNIMEQLKSSQANRYEAGNVDASYVGKGKDFANNGKIQSQKRATDYAFQRAGGDAAQTYGTGKYDDLGKSIGAANTAVGNMSYNLKNIKHRANHNANQNKS